MDNNEHLATKHTYFYKVGIASQGGVVRLDTSTTSERSTIITG